MAQTFQEAQAAITSCDSVATKLKRMKALLDATEEALFNSASTGSVDRYKVNTGQTIIEVEGSSTSELMSQYKTYLAFYNELCGIYGGGNVMVFRDASTSRGRF